MSSTSQRFGRRRIAVLRLREFRNLSDADLEVMQNIVTCQIGSRRLRCIAVKEVAMPQQTPAIFIADSAGLDFLNSIATPVDAEFDWIGDGEGLLAWLEQARLVPAEVLNAMRKQAKPGEIDRVAAQARKLREWFRAFVREHSSKQTNTAQPAELEPLNRILSRDEEFGQLVPHKKGKTTAYEFRRTRHWRSPESLLLPIGQSLARLLAEEDLGDVKVCEGASCTLMFADHTRGRSRRWCSMGICGNRAKQIAHRNRLKELR
jgi:predicted RNA-binding Zn ribbon-like protein